MDHQKALIGKTDLYEIVVLELRQEIKEENVEGYIW